MNIFFLDANPKEAARNQCDKHVVKMTCETGQMLSTCHRVIGGDVWFDKGKNGRRIKRWSLGDDLEFVLNKACHINHSCNVWIRESEANYNWAYEHFVYLAEEFKFRFGKEHGSYTRLNDSLGTPSKEIPSLGLTKPALAMPDKYKVDCPVDSYRSYYIGDKKDIAVWEKGRPAPHGI